MISIDPLPRLPVGWKEFSDLLRASIPKTNEKDEPHRVSSADEVSNRVPDERLSNPTSSHPQTKDKRMEQEEKDPIRDAIQQLRNGFPRSPPSSGKLEDGIDVLA